MPSLPLLWLIALLVLWATLLFGGYLRGNPTPSGDRRMPAWTRIGSTFVLVIAAWSWYLIARRGVAGDYALLIAIGMMLGLLGDLFMARLIPAGNRVLAGMGAFALGHVVYIAAGLRLSNTMALNASLPRLLGWLVWLLIGAAGWYLVIFRGQRPAALHWAALPYSLLLASTAGVATGLALQDSAFIPFAMGAALFLFSDLTIAAKLFAKKSVSFMAMDDLVWLTYGPGQMLIVYSVLAAIR